MESLSTRRHFWRQCEPATTIGLVMVAALVLGCSPSGLPSQLSGRRVAFTTPLTYAGRLAGLLELRGATPLHLPTVVVDTTARNLAALRPYLGAGALDSFSALAFTSRNGITAFSLGLADADGTQSLSDSGELFTIAALGKDAELLQEEGFLSKICRNPSRIRVLVPEIASPAGLVESLGAGSGRRILCPVPSVVDLEEPPVVPDFLRELWARGWVPERVPAYETRWTGPLCTEGLVVLDTALDAMVFTSSAEVEGLMKGLEALGWDWGKVRRRWPKMLVCAHGPVTAKGVESFGVRVDVMISKLATRAFSISLVRLAARQLIHGLLNTDPTDRLG
ncbi:hypothetical protein OPV22_010003 [Ensete ventricosum]|uniref:Tetrapyrrole biosynthesis uroporphyrinogen III synthase domain-containing protein n=1 Tax=Ensete ventricosum TaxID=4639 RepID=A0AAV8RJU6_ENSVE|nr:hypothetical protein OPV22_010003 [Ensete ventricosum]